MCTLLAKIQVHPGKESLFEEVMAHMYRQTHDTEDNVLRYEYWRGRDPGFYYCLLAFPDAPAFWAHQASDHHEGEMQRFTECIAELDLEIVDPVSAASPLPATQEAGLPAAAPAWLREQAATYPVALADWWKGLRAC